MAVKRFFIIAGLIISGICSWVSFASQQSSEDLSYEKYKVIYERNIFSKNRKSFQEKTASDHLEKKKSVVLSLYVLRGVAVNDGQSIAFIEEAISGRSMRMQIDAELLGGRITDIQCDHVVFTKNDQTKIIKIGEPFGKTETVTTKAASEDIEITEDKSSPVDSKKDTTTVGQDDVLKKMLERRKSELK